MESEQWVKLKPGNAWGVDYLSYEPLRNGYADQRRSIDVANGDVVEFRRRPDFPTETGRVHLVARSTMVGDMGHVYPVSFKWPTLLVGDHETLDLASVYVRNDAFKMKGPIHA